jgi:hypothetical protein
MVSPFKSKPEVSEMSRNGKSFALLVGLALTAALAVARPKTLDVPLAWTPNPGDRYQEPSLDLTGGIYSVRLESFVDAREKGNQIGENSEKKETVPVYTRSDVAGFLTEVVTAQLKRTGLDIRNSDADRIVRAEVMELWVQETNRYHGTVRLKLTVTDAAGKELWVGMVGGVGENWGRSLKPLNYTETISNSVLDLVANILKNPGFIATVRKTATSS